MEPEKKPLYPKTTFSLKALSTNNLNRSVLVQGNAFDTSSISLPGVPRPLGHGSDDEDENDLVIEGEQIVEAVDLSSFSRGKNEDELVIPVVRNKDWRIESLKRRGVYIPPNQTQKVNEEDYENKDRLGYGINNMRDSSNNSTMTGGSVVDEVRIESPIASSRSYITDEEAARKALIEGNEMTDDSFVLPLPSSSLFDGGNLTEEEAYKRDIESRPDMASLDAYARVPVEKFGAALLRGMTERPKNSSITKTEVHDSKKKEYEVKQRPSLLGLGAKPMSHAVEEPGSWGKATSKRSNRAEKSYVPVVLINKTTGEVVDENCETDIVRESVEDKNKESGGPSTKKSESNRDYHRDKHGDSRRRSEGYRDRESRSKRYRTSSRERRDHYGDTHRDRDRQSRTDRDRYSRSDHDRYSRNGHDKHSLGGRERSSRRENNR
ncbi:hypothetical protein NADFUDRAFT_52376 [Nadsonia fulvescens var. elongata DSM 6958]|uniref:Pre-mRNA-splicing factor n=1 Tax=Nadsonia fulvescens var. elongata DSM 6958 TaxID=857566 RepID=A0A1E3PII6_9ASCO|nr:hypothetical protein NADFUDRAFT_52376 [Nadsonia fulvescens var. elongata DSM 6958]